MRRRRALLVTFAVVVIVLIALRVALPAIALHVANERLAHIGEYSGHVDDLDLALIRGAATLHGIRIEKPAAHQQTPFYTADRADASIQWNALMHGRVVMDVTVFHPVVNLVQGSTPDRSQLGTGVNWPAEIRAMSPFDFNRIQIHDGVVTFRAPGIRTNDSLTMRNLELVVRNLANAEPDRTHDGFADIDLRADIMGKAPLTVRGRLNPMQQTPTFDMDMTLRDAHLADVNPWLRQFLNVDAEQGTFSMFSEVAAANGEFKGYVKPILEDPKFLSASDEGVLKKTWEALVQLGADLFKNHPEDQVATQIPISGRFDKPQPDLLATLVNVLRNAFVGAFTRALEHSVSLRDVDTGNVVMPGAEHDDRSRRSGD